MNTRGDKTKLGLYGFLLCMTLSLVLSSCYGPELDFINDKLVTLESRLDSLKAKLESKKFIQSVTPIERGFRVTFDDTSYYDITSGINGQRGENGTSWIIDEYGMWRYSTATGGYMDSGFRAVPNDGQDGSPGKDGQAAPSPKISADEFWILYEWSNIDSTYHEVITKIPANMAPFIVSNTEEGYVELNVPSVDSVTYNPPQIVYETVKLPFFVEDPIIISFKGYGEMTGDAIRMLDYLSFKYWQITHTPAIAAWGGTKEITQDTLITLGLPDSTLVVVFASNKEIPSPRMSLQDSKRNTIPYFDVENPIKITDNKLLTKVYYDTLYYSKMNYVTVAPSTPTLGNIHYFLVNDNKERSIASYPIEAQSPAIPATPVQTLGGKSPATSADKYFGDTRYRYFTADSTSTAISFALGNSEYVFDYLIRDTINLAHNVPSLVTILADKKSFKFNYVPSGTTPPATSPASVDTASYKLVVDLLLNNGNIRHDTIVVSTRDTVRDLIRNPLP
ncbi:MAG: hypothetical protein LBD21_07375 [Tannerellaceae bacterium]|jgi:hypothetical protein|nr:hypothetical protein [Tannerellaceae bacterium]